MAIQDLFVNSKERGIVKRTKLFTFHTIVATFSTHSCEKTKVTFFEYNPVLLGFAHSIFSFLDNLQPFLFLESEFFVFSLKICFFSCDASIERLLIFVMFIRTGAICATLAVVAREKLPERNLVTGFRNFR